MTIRIVSFLLLLAASLLTSSTYAQSPYKGWLSKKYKKHPLAGKIWSTVDKKFIKREDFVSRLAYRNYILFGETHDNADHHRLHAWLIKKIKRYDRKPVIVMEMITKDFEPAIKEYFKKVRAKKQKKPAFNLGPVLQWTERGWPDWKIYMPIASAIFANNLTLAAGSPTKKEEKKFKQNSFFKGLSREERKALAVDKEFSLSVNNSLKDELSKSHCGLLPYTALKSMASVQRYRDAILADSMIKAAKPYGTILIAGSGHVRNDRGVPYYIKRRIPAASIINMATIEVDPNKKSPEQYLPVSASKQPVLDYIWFTAAHDRTDPCIAFKKHLKKKQSKKQSEPSKPQELEKPQQTN